MDPFALFNPAAYNPLDPQTMMGIIDPQRLLDTAAVFPGGALMLVFALFWAPVGPGIPAGVLLARHAGINPIVTLGLYATSDVLGACVCHPWFTFLKKVASRVPILRALGGKLMKLALIGARPPRIDDLQDGVKGMWPALFRIGTIGFGLDVYHAGMVVAGLPVPRVAGWLAAIAGDLVWFAILLITSMVTATVTEDDRVIAVVMLVVMILVPQIAKRYIPALRDPPRTTAPAASDAREALAAPATLAAPTTDAASPVPVLLRQAPPPAPAPPAPRRSRRRRARTAR
jgi:hypothetical protein